MNIEGLIARLRHLVDVCRGGEGVFRDAALAALDDHLRTLFYNYSQQRGQLAAELYHELKRLGSDFLAAETSARNRRLAGAARSPLDHDDATILADCLHEVSTALQVYEQALIEVDRPPSARQIIHRQYAAIRAAGERLEELARLYAARSEREGALAAK